MTLSALLVTPVITVQQSCTDLNKIEEMAKLKF